MFQNYLAYTASACANHKTVPRRFNHVIRYEVKVINLENSFDLGEKPSQELKFPLVIRMRLAMTSGMSSSSGSVTPAGVQRCSSNSCTWSASKGRNS